jgi:iron complex transport system substrate-binding protein
MGVLGGCARAPQHQDNSSLAPKTSSFPKDDLGRAVNLKAPAQRVVCIGPGATETIFALGAGSKLVGRDQVSDYPAATKGVPIVGDYTGPFVEKVVAVKPDLVIVQGETYDKTRADNWQQKIGAPVAVLVPTSLERVGIGIRKIGQWMGDESKAKKVAEPLMNISHPNSLRHTALFEVQRSPLWAAGRGTLYSDIISYFGMRNLPEFSGYRQYSIESLMAEQPDVYIVAEASPDRKRVLLELRRDPVLAKLKCIREGRVIVLHSDYILRPGPRLVLGLKEFETQRKMIFSKESVYRVHSAATPG